jgi:predicted permease
MPVGARTGSHRAGARLQKQKQRAWPNSSTSRANAGSFPPVRNARRSFARAIFDALLFAFPRDTRTQYRAEMRDDFATRLTATRMERGRSAMWTFAMHNYLDTLTTGLSERCAAVARDITYAIRGAMRAPLFALTVILTIGIAVGANAAVDGFISAIVFTPVPVADINSLVIVYETNERTGLTRGIFTYRDAMFLRSQARTLEAVGIAAESSGALLGAGPPRMLHGEAASGDVFSVLRIHPQIGRLLTRDDERGSSMIVVLSDAVWRTSFGADPSVIGRIIRIGDDARRVVGVAPTRAYEPGGRVRGVSAATDFWIPLRQSAWEGAGYQLRAFARVRPGMSNAAVQADLRRVFAVLAQRYPAYAGVSARAPALRDEVFRDGGVMFLTFAIIVFGVLVVACANVANLFLSRGSARTGEIAVRFAVGATRRRVTWQLLTEMTVYASLGGVIAVVVAFEAEKYLFSALPADFSFARDANIGWTMLVLTFVFVLVAVAIAGIGPAFALSRPNIFGQLKGGGRETHRVGGMRRWFVAGEIAVAVAIVTTATLSVRSLDGMVRKPLGISPAGLYVVDLSRPSFARYNTPAKANAFFDRVGSLVRSTPGITAAAWSSTIPTISTPSTLFDISGRTFARGHRPVSLFGSVSADVFATMHIPLIAGRLFNARDRSNGAPVTIVSRAFARAYFSSVAAAVGARVTPAYSTYGIRVAERKIVGVVEDVRPNLNSEAWPEIYLPLEQIPTLDAYLVVATNGPASTAVTAARAAVAAVDPEIPPPDVSSLEHDINISLGGQDAATYTLTALATIALLLAVAGIYAVVSYDVGRRTHEIGIRMALGGDGLRIVFAVLWDALIVTGVGLCVGAVLSVLAAKAVDGQLVDFTYVDPATYAEIATVILVAIMIATLLPVRRAVRVQPVVALRYE